MLAFFFFSTLPFTVPSLVRSIARTTGVAHGDKSAAIADINRYERGRQTKYTDVNIRPVGCRRVARVLHRARRVARVENALNERKEPTGWSILSSLPPPSPSTVTTFFQSTRRVAGTIVPDAVRRRRTRRTVKMRPPHTEPKTPGLLSARFAISEYSKSAPIVSPLL